MLNKRLLTGSDFAAMVISAGRTLHANVNTVNNLNVFPVPDGDTGTNMNMTLSSGVEQVRNKPSSHIGKCAEILSKGLLMGARGNSGVIMSQLFRGFAKSVAAYEEITTAQFAAALQQGVDTAYQAVVKPVEGTILTVSREAAKHALTAARRTDDHVEFMREVLAKAKEALSKTPDLLPVLKQVGVVDSGGQGLVFVYEGFLSALLNDERELLLEATKPATETKPASSQQPTEAVRHMFDQAQKKLATEDIEFLYDMEFFINISDRKVPGTTFDAEKFRKQLQEIGDSILVIPDDEVVKVHVHTKAPGDVLNMAIRYGELNKFHLENMRDQHRNILDAPGHDAMEESNGHGEVDEPAARKRYGMVAVAAGEGITEIFESLGVDVVLSGGQTMNPSTEDIVQAIERVGADQVFVLPNNSNIIMAAQQARDLLDVGVIVIPSKTIPQGMAAILAFQEDAEAERNEQLMLDAVRAVRSGAVTNAVRDTTIDDVEIKEHDMLGILDNKIVVSTPSLEETCRALIGRMIVNGDEVLTILVGAEADPETTERLAAYVAEAYPDVEVERLAGGQPVYHYLFSAE